MNNLSIFSIYKKLLVSIIIGLLCILLSPYGIEADWGEIRINIPWSLIFPILISMAFGWRFGLLAGLSGGALFPFLLWGNNGWPNLSTTIIYLFLYIMVGLVYDKNYFSKFHQVRVRLFIAIALCIIAFGFYYSFLFNLFLSFNPPFWKTSTIKSLPQEILYGFLFKDSINIIILTLISETLLKLPFIRKFLGIPVELSMQANSKIFILTIIISIFVWITFVGLGAALLRGSYSLQDEHISLALFVIISSGFIVARILFVFNENQLGIQNELAKSEENFKKLVWDMQVGVLLQGSKAEILLSNPKALELLGISEDQLLGKTSFDPNWNVIHEDGTLFIGPNHSVYQAIETKRAIRGLVMGVYRPVTADRVWLLVDAVPQLKTDGTIQQVVCTFIDITERKLAELQLKGKNEEIEAHNKEYQQINEELTQTNEQLYKAKEKAEESDRLKTAFLQNLSHEIRTPMNAIMGFSALISDHFNNKQKLEYFSEIINRRCNDLLDIINDILDIAKIESGQLPVNIEEFNLKELFSELTIFFTEYKERIGKQQIELTLHALDEPYKNVIITDKTKLKQIFINLITNSFKFTSEGSIKGGCKFENNNLIFYVADSGIGIPKDKHNAVFERFTQLNHGLSKNIGGTGLGLSIVKGLIELLGGQIQLESDTGRGSTFSFIIQYQSKQHENIKTNDLVKDMAYQFSNKTILIVEDDIYNAEYLKEILATAGFNIVQTPGGAEAVKIALSKTIDLILMDIRLPDINGYEATRQIKLQNPNMKIIAQTAYASHDERHKAILAGCSDYITKPTKRELLLSILSKHLS